MGLLVHFLQAEERAKAEKASTSAPRVEQEESNMDDLMALANLKLGGAREAAAAEQLPKGALLPFSVQMLSLEGLKYA